jgi:hypothetical protein
MPVRHTPISVHAGSSARQNPFLGIALTKAQRHAKAIQKKTLYRTKYMRCRQAQKNKGKTVYPDPGAAKKCKGEYNKWQKYRGKAGTRAMKLSAKLEKKGKLDPELQALLEQDIADSALEPTIDPSLTDAELATMDIPIDESTTSLDEEEGGIPMWAIAAGGLAVVGTVGFLLLRK